MLRIHLERLNFSVDESTGNTLYFRVTVEDFGKDIAMGLPKKVWEWLGDCSLTSNGHSTDIEGENVRIHTDENVLERVICMMKTYWKGYFRNNEVYYWMDDQDNPKTEGTATL